MIMTIMQEEIGLVSNNTMRWFILILMVFSLVAVLVSFIQRGNATKPAAVSLEAMTD